MPSINASRLYDPEWQFIRHMDPDMYAVKEMIEATKVNPQVLPQLIKGIASIGWGTGYGKVQVFIEGRKVSAIKPEESDLVNKEALKIDE